MKCIFWTEGVTGWAFSWFCSVIIISIALTHLSSRLSRHSFLFFLTLVLLRWERDELYQVSFHILILSGRREKTLMEKVSLPLSPPAFGETRPSPYLLLSRSVFESRSLTGNVSGQFLTWICIPQWWVTALKGQEKTGASIGSWKLFKETDELNEQRGSHSSPPSLHPCKPPLALKNRTSLNFATWCLYHSV